jgi:hypothetical protein
VLSRDERNAKKILRRARIGNLEKRGPDEYLVLGSGGVIIFGPLAWEEVLDLVDPMRKLEKQLNPESRMRATAWMTLPGTLADSPRKAERRWQACQMTEKPTSWTSMSSSRT